MSDTVVSTAPRVQGTFHFQWGPIIAGAIAAAALAAVLHAFAAAVGLAVGSTAPTWRDASIGLWILSGVYLILVALASYGLVVTLPGYCESDLRRPEIRTKPNSGMVFMGSWSGPWLHC